MLYDNVWNLTEFDKALTHFSGGEYHYNFAKEGPWDKEITIFARLNSWEDIGKLLTLTNVYKNNGVRVSVIIPYFPGARQDRITSDVEPFTLKVYADLINAQNYERVIVCDPHSDVLLALVNNVKCLDIDGIIKRVIEDANPDCILAPDAGSSKRIFSQLSRIGCDLPIVQCLKHRDTKTGKLSRFEVCGNVGRKKCLILDDICDGGGTYFGLYDQLYQEAWQAPDSVSLYVTHGIFSKGCDKLVETFKRIYTTNSIKRAADYPVAVTVYDLI